MPWFCYGSSRKRSNKTRVVGMGRQDNILSNGHQTLFVIVQDYISSAGDELSVQRGQIVEVMNTKRDRVYVRNMNSGSGYVPKALCLELHKIRGNFNNTSTDQSTNPIPCSINVGTLQRSGSSVNSVEVHQVNGSPPTVGVISNDGPNPLEERAVTPTSSSSQAIYEVPRTPTTCSNCNQNVVPVPPPASQAQVENRAPTQQRPPSLPPRSLNLSSPVNTQRDFAHTPGLSNHHQQYHNQLTGSNHFPATTPGSSRAPPNSNRLPLAPTPSPNCPPNFPPSRTPGSSQTPTMSSRPLMPPHLAQRGGHGARSSPTSSSFTRRSSLPTHALAAIRPANIGFSQPSTRTDFSPTAVANTPGSAGIPSLAPSPLSARVVPTPGSPGTPPSFATTPGCAPRFIGRVATPGSVDAANMSRWPGAATPETTPPYGHRSSIRSRQVQRRSTDFALLDSAIAENTAEERIIHLKNVPRQHSTRQSQPCISVAGLQGSPHRPKRLSVRRSLSMQERTNMRIRSPNINAAPSPVRQVSIHRAPSYQEAVMTEDERVFGVAAGIRPSELARTTTSTNQGHRAAGFRRGSGRLDSTQSDPADSDDVFLPDIKKPTGIFRCIRAYQPKFKGEIGAQEDELVIVLDYGRGEWAWVISSTNAEGLIPKSVLTRYNHSKSHSGSRMREQATGNGNNNGTDVATQTELAYVPLAQDSSASCSGTNTLSGESGASIPIINASSPLATVVCSRRKKSNSEGAPVSNPAVLEPPKEWFDTIDSIDDRARVRPSAGSVADHNTTSSLRNEQHEDSSVGLSRTFSSPPAPSAGSPASSHAPLSSNKEHGEASAIIKTRSDTTPTVRSKSTNSKQSPPVVIRKKKRSGQPSSLSAIEGGAVLVTSGTMHYHDRISGLGSVSFDNRSNGPSSSPKPQHRSRKNPSTLLTVVKDYTPPSTAKNCLPLKKGEVLHSQPHMHYPKGWMWVWHANRRSFGYIPKSYVAYTYDGPQKRERQGTDTQEAAV